jgi:hypothetical protein
MSEIYAFAPLYIHSGNAGVGGNLVASVTISATTSAASAALPITSTDQVQIANQTTAWAFVNFGLNTTQITAATVAASYPVAPGAVVVVTLDSEVAAVSCILAAGATAGNVTFTLGNGL